MILLGGIPYYWSFLKKGLSAAQDLENKVDAYRQLSKDKRTVHLVMVTTNGIARNCYMNMIQNEITLDDLFAV